MYLSIKYKFMLGVFVIVMMAIVSFAFLSLQREQALLYKSQQEFSTSINAVLLEQVTGELEKKSHIPVQDRIRKSASSITNLKSIVRYSEGGEKEIVYRSDRSDEWIMSDSLVKNYLPVNIWYSSDFKTISRPGNNQIIIVSPVILKGAKLSVSSRSVYGGVFVVTYSTSAIYERLNETQSGIILISVILIILSLLLAYIAAHFLVSAVNKLTLAIRQFQSGDKSTVIDIRNKDEIGDLTQSINEMMVSIKTSMNILNDQKMVLENMTVQAQKSESKLRDLLENARDMIVHFDSSGKIRYANQKFLKLCHTDSIQIISEKSIHELVHPENAESLHYYLDNMQRDEIGNTILTVKMLGSEGQWIETEMTCSVLHEEHDKMFQAMLRDVTDRSILREELVQAKKLESIGRLAGGIAHDFNNLLAIIIPNAELVLTGGSERKIHHYAEQILSASNRAGDVVRQLLDFSRQKPAVMKPSGLHALLEVTILLLEKLIPENITILEELNAEYDIVEMEETQIQQILINMAVNARDAMATGGTLTFSTKNIRAAKEFSIKEYIQLNISDTGAGIDKEIIPKIFDPFFTTKSIGDGTGLGLAGAYGIVQLHHGTINVQSEKNKGTTFTITFPLHKPFMI